MPTVLTAGHVNWDVTLRVDRLPEPGGETVIRSQRQSGGGSAANVASALATLDISVELVGSIGDDDDGALLTRELEEAGVDLAGLRTVVGAETAVKYLLVDDDGTVSILGNDGVNEAVSPADIDPDRVRAVDHVHLTSQRPETAARLGELAIDAGIPVSVDLGRRPCARDFGDAVAAADIVFATDREMDAMVEAGYAVDDGTCTIVTTYGADGAAIHGPEGHVQHPGFEIETVDTTGAGDAFAAGFLARTLEASETEYDEILEYANACGALAASQNGARSVPTPPAIERFLAARN